MADETLWIDEEPCRALADSLGTVGQELQVLGKGGAIVEGLTTGLPGAETPEACRTAARAADQAEAAVGTAMVEMNGLFVGAIATFKAQEAANTQNIGAVGEGVR